MAQTARFVRGSQVFDLDGVYALTEFVPPPINPAYNIATGTSANQTGGGALVGTVQQDRELTFGVRILGSSEVQIENAARRLAAFLAAKGDTLYFEYKASDRPDPLYGQFDAPLRYEVITCHTWFERAYRDAPARATGLVVGVDMTIKPLAVGIKQKLVSASGGVFEDVYGAEDGASRGLAIFEGTTNKLTNPVFGHATYNNTWSAGANVMTAANTNATYCLPGLTTSNKLTCNGADTAYYQSINAGNTNKHSLTAYFYLPDLGTPTSSDMQLLYDVALSTSFQSLGDGLWLAYADNIDGINSAQETGVSVKTGRTIYLCGVQLEEKAYHTPLCYGDLLGCAWTGTEHASTSTRTAGNVTCTRTDDVLNTAEGSVAIVWKPYYASTFSAHNLALFGAYAAGFASYGLYAYYAAADDKFYLSDGTNTISTAAQTFAAGDVLYLTFTWGPGGLNIYKNGASAATGATYTPGSVANAAILVFGSLNSTVQASGPFLGFTIYGVELTAAQALAIYTAQAAVSAGSCVDSIPWLWTKDGDNVVDNWDSAAAENWMIAGGITGSEEASTYWRGTASASGGHSTYFSRLEMPYNSFIKPDFLSYIGGPGTASVTTSDTMIGSVLFNTQEFKLLEGRNLLPMVFASDAGTSTLKLQTWVSADAGYYTSAYEPVSFLGTAGYSIDSAPPLNLFANDDGLDVFDITRTTGAYIYGKRTAGTADFVLKFLQIFPAPFAVLRTDQDSAGESGFVMHETSAYGVNSALLSFQYELLGSPINLVPGHYNAVIALQGEEGALETGAEAIGYTGVYIAPRWGLI